MQGVTVQAAITGIHKRRKYNHRKQTVLHSQHMEAAIAVAARIIIITVLITAVVIVTIVITMIIIITAAIIIMIVIAITASTVMPAIIRRVMVVQAGKCL